MALAFFRNKNTDAAKQKLVVLHAPIFPRAASAFERSQGQDFHSFIHDGNSLWRDSAIDEALRDILAIRDKPFDRRVARPRNPTFSQWKSDSARQKNRQPFVCACQPCRGERLSLVEMHKLEAIACQQSADGRGCRDP